MLYPEIVDIPTNCQVYAFDKLDGQLVWVEASRKRGLYKYGRRHGLLDARTLLLAEEAPLLIQEKYEESFLSVLKEQRWDSAVFFMEFYGANSFCGRHQNEKHQVTLFDIGYRKVLLPPQEFLSITKNMSTAPLLYRGNCNSDFLDSVKTSSLIGMSFEGVVCKTTDGKRFKVKSKAWLDRLRLETTPQEFERLK